MQVIPDSLSACPDPTPMWGGKKGELRDWTTRENVLSQRYRQGGLYQMKSYLALWCLMPAAAISRELVRLMGNVGFVSEGFKDKKYNDRRLLVCLEYWPTGKAHLKRRNTLLFSRSRVCKSQHMGILLAHT